MAADDEFVIEPVRRAAAFERLLSGTATRAELQEHLDVSRATLHRVVTFLREHDLLVETDDGLELTTLGTLVGEEVTGYTDRMTTAADVAPLVNGIDRSALPEPIDLDLFRDTRATLPEPGQPQRPAHRLSEIVETAEGVRGFSPVVMPIYVEVFHREILEGMETKVLVEPSVHEGLEAQYPDQLAEAMATGSLELHVHEPLPFSLFVTPETVAVLGYDDDDVLRVLVEGEGDPLRGWATDVYDALWSAATA